MAASNSGVQDTSASGARGETQENVILNLLTFFNVARVPPWRSECFTASKFRFKLAIKWLRAFPHLFPGVGSPTFPPLWYSSGE
jgi:hypothetical protein